MGRILYRGRTVRGFGLGAAAAFAKAQADLANQMVAVIGAGDAYSGADAAAFALDYSDAVSAYKAAGVAGVSSVGPGIDMAGAPSVTQPLTQQAWKQNADLQAIPANGLPDPKNGLPKPYYTKNAAIAAAVMVHRMAGLYQQAIAAGVASSGGGAPLPIPNPNAPAVSSASKVPVIAAVAAIGIAATVWVASTLKGLPRHAPA